MRIPGLPFDAATRSAKPAGARWVFPALGSAGIAESGQVVTPLTALQQTAVFACIQILSQSIATMPARIYRIRNANSSAEIDTTHAANALLSRRPNNRQTPYAFWSNIMVHLLTQGNAYAVISRKANRPSALLPIEPSRITVKIDAGGELYYEVRVGHRGDEQQTYTLPALDVLHFRYFSLDGILGLSPVGVCRATIGQAIGQDRFASSLYRNAARPSGHIEFAEKLTDETHSRLQESWAREYAGAANSGKTPILDRGMKYVPTAMKAEDLSYIESRKLTGVEIAQIFRVPGHMLGYMDKVAYASAELFGVEFTTYTLLPMVTNFEQECDAKLLAPSEALTHQTQFDPSVFERADSTTQADNMAKGRNWGWFSVNDCRRRLNLPSIGPQGDVYLQPVNMAAPEGGA